MCRMPAISATDLGIPPVFNATSWFVDRHSEEGRAESVAIECGDERVTYRQLAERVNRCGSALRELGRASGGARDAPPRWMSRRSRTHFSAC